METHLTGHADPDSGLVDLMLDMPRILHREWVKLCYYLPRALILLALHFIPAIGQTLLPVLWFLFSAWMMAIQYCNYTFDNNNVTFKTMRAALRRHKVTNMQFGALISLFTMIPIVNLVLLPVAVFGVTAMWVDKYRACYTGSDS